MSRNSVKWTVIAGVVAMVLSACGGSSSTPDFCDVYQEFDALNADAERALFDPGELERIIREVVELTRDAEEVAPSEIRSDVVRALAGFEAALALYASADFDLTQLDAAAAVEYSDRHAAATDEAVASINAWADANC